MKFGFAWTFGIWGEYDFLWGIFGFEERLCCRVGFVFVGFEVWWALLLFGWRRVHVSRLRRGKTVMIVYVGVWYLNRVPTFFEHYLGRSFIWLEDSYVDLVSNCVFLFFFAFDFFLDSEPSLGEGFSVLDMLGKCGAVKSSHHWVTQWAPHLPTDWWPDFQVQDIPLFGQGYQALNITI